MEELDPEKLISPDLLTKEDIEQLLPILSQLQQWAAQVQDHALKQALRGVRYEGFKVVRGRTTRWFTDPEKAIATLVKAGYESPMFYERKMLGPAEIEKIVGKTSFNRLLGKDVRKSLGAPTLVPEEDSRPTFKAGNRDTAASDFRD